MKAVKPPANEIIVKRIVTAPEEHGGAWKIALADMMTAMMAFFLVMWLISATDEVTLKGIADHFKPPGAKPREQIAGSEGLFGGTSILDPEGMPWTPAATADMPGRDADDEAAPKTPKMDPVDDTAEKIKEADEQAFREVEDKIVDLISRDPTLAPSRHQVEFIREKEGLRIQIVDDENSSMFDVGTDKLLPSAAALIDKINTVLKAVPNKLIIRGHTDSRPFAVAQHRNNWTLSAERAEATRLYLQNAGIDPKKFVKIEGVADAEPYGPGDLLDARNRRINIILKYQEK